MKRCLLILSTVMVVISCSKEPSPQEVTVSLDYSFIESGDMTKAGEDVYSKFYTKYIETRQITPKTFDITFTNIETGAIYQLRGNWNKNHLLKLISGEYEVTGVSHPTTIYCLDTLFICFNDTITISNDMQSVVLKADYDSYLLMFDVSDKNNIEYEYGSGSSYDNPHKIPLEILDSTYYAFFNEKMGNKNSIVISRGDEKSYINMNNIPFKKGKYYYFNDLSNSFDIPPMESGS